MRRLWGKRSAGTWGVPENASPPEQEVSIGQTRYSFAIGPCWSCKENVNIEPRDFGSKQGTGEDST
jgi:hypothetical protein